MFTLAELWWTSCELIEEGYAEAADVSEMGYSFITSSYDGRFDEDVATF